MLSGCVSHSGLTVPPFSPVLLRWCPPMKWTHWHVGTEGKQRNPRIPKHPPMVTSETPTRTYRHRRVTLIHSAAPTGTSKPSSTSLQSHRHPGSITRTQQQHPPWLNPTKRDDFRTQSWHCYSDTPSSSDLLIQPVVRLMLRRPQQRRHLHPPTPEPTPNPTPATHPHRFLVWDGEQMVVEEVQSTSTIGQEW